MSSIDDTIELSYSLDIRATLMPEQLEIVEQRAEVKRLAWEEVDGICECCDFEAGYDLHEVFETRAGIPVAQQLRIHVRENCALVCRACHNGPATTQAFKARFARRLKRLGHRPLEPEEVTL